MALWGGRFSESMDKALNEFSESVSFDHRLYSYDILGSIAHVEMLGKTKIIPQQDADAIIKELQAIKKEIDSGIFSFDKELEDIHMNIEKVLIDRLGDVGARIHSARSRNDQVATDIRLYLRSEIGSIISKIGDLQKSLVKIADKYSSLIIPGFTHLQHAQPVVFAHHMLAYVEMFHRDIDRLKDCCTRLNILPLGSGALAGTSLPIDRHFVAKKLGFDGVTRNSMDAVSDRDFVIECVSDLAIFMMHISRFSEDLIFWMSQECAFITLGDPFCTGSSLMPQKKNPDIAELSRGKTGRVYGALMSLLTVMKGLPLCYNRDMQEDKEPLFDSIDTVHKVLTVFAPMLESIGVNEEHMAHAVSDSNLMATDLAEWLVAQGIPFRLAHEKVGKLIAFCQSQKTNLEELTLPQMQEIIPEANGESLTLFSASKSVASRNIEGGTSFEQVKNQIAYWKSAFYGDPKQS